MEGHHYFLHVSYTLEYNTSEKKQRDFITSVVPRRAISGGIIRQHIAELPVREFVRSPKSFRDMKDNGSLMNIIPLYMSGLRTGIGYVPRSIVPHPNRFLPREKVRGWFPKWLNPFPYLVPPPIKQTIKNRRRQSIEINTHEFDMILDVIAHVFAGVKAKTFDTKTHRHIVYAFEDYYPPFIDSKSDIISQSALKIEYRIKRFLKELPQNVNLEFVYKTTVADSPERQYVIFPQDENVVNRIPTEFMLPRDKKILEYAEQTAKIFHLRHERGPLNALLQSVLNFRTLRKMELELYNPDKLSPVPTAAYTFYIIEKNDYERLLSHRTDLHLINEKNEKNKKDKDKMFERIKRFTDSFHGKLTFYPPNENTPLNMYKLDFYNANVVEHMMMDIVKQFPSDFRIIRVTAPLQYMSDNTCGEFQIYPFDVGCSKSKTIRPVYDFVLRDVIEKFHAH